MNLRRKHLSFISRSSFLLHRYTLAEAAGVEPARDVLPDCLANSSGYQFRHASQWCGKVDGE